MASITNLENYDSDQHFTPKFIFEALKVEFDLDVASSKLATNVPALKHYTIEDDALSQPWYGLVWMNPPYSKPTPWVEKFISHNNGIALLPITRGRWWDSLWSADTVIVPTPYNFKFERPDGVKRDITFRTMLCGIGQGRDIVAKCGLGKPR
jgi:phage N-6-adenine-methyltransferase